MSLIHNHKQCDSKQVSDIDKGDVRYGEIKKVTIVGVITNLALAVSKISFGIIGQSQSLIADGIHSVSDLLSDALVLFAAKHANQDADEDHPYGHGRFETLGTVVLALTLLGAAATIVAIAFQRVGTGTDSTDDQRNAPSSTARPESPGTRPVTGGGVARRIFKGQ